MKERREGKQLQPLFRQVATYLDDKPDMWKQFNECLFLDMEDELDTLLHLSAPEISQRFLTSN